MVIKNRLFTYPVLAQDTDDYREGSFEVTPEIIGESAEYYDIKFEFKLDNRGIQNLINEDQAEFVVHLECSHTSYRAMIRTQSNVICYHLAKKDVNGYVTLLGVVLAKKDIHFYKNIALDRDYDDVDIHFKKGAFIAYYNMPRLNIYKQYEQLKASESIFTMCSKERKSILEHNPVRFDISGDKIRITVDDDVYASYIKLKDRVELKSTIISSFVYPAVIYMLEELRYQDMSLQESCQDSLWFRQLDKYYEKEGKKFIDVVNSGESITVVAQELLDKPIGAMMGGIHSILEDR